MAVQNKPLVRQDQPRTLNQKLPPVVAVKLVFALINLLARIRRKVTPAPLSLLEMVGTYIFVSNAIIAAARLSIADLLKDGPKSSEELAEAVGANPESLYRLLRALTAEFRALFEAAGFKLTRTIPTPSYSYVIEGVPM